jgi:hypothetical protein
MLDPALPGLEEVIDALMAAGTTAPATTAYQTEIRRAVERAVTDAVMNLAENAAMPQVRAIATLRLQRRMNVLARTATPGGQPPLAEGALAHQTLLAADIRRFLERPAAPAPRMGLPSAPPGAPIGDPALDWLRLIDPPCAWDHQRH